MSGHSKWAQIKRQKGVTDAKRGQTFTRLGNAITIAARQGGGDSGSNFTLRLAIERAHTANMPKENIERAIKRGTGELGGVAIEETIYEAYGPGGVGLIINVQTDNKNRALSNIKAALNKHNGKLANAGAVAYNFIPIGNIIIERLPESSERQIENIINSSASDYGEEDEAIIVETEPTTLEKVKHSLEESGEKIAEASITKKAINKVQIDDETRAKLDRLIETLEELDDVAEVTCNAK